MNIKKILIVDDEENIRLLLDSYLSDLGFETMLAKNGNDVLDSIKQIKPDMVFLDIKLPGIDGIEVLKLIKDYDPNISVIMVSGYATEEMAKESLKIGAFDYIKKPLDLEKVSEMISCVDLLSFAT